MSSDKSNALNLQSSQPDNWNKGPINSKKKAQTTLSQPDPVALCHGCNTMKRLNTNVLCGRCRSDEVAGQTFRQFVSQLFVKWGMPTHQAVIIDIVAEADRREQAEMVALLEGLDIYQKCNEGCNDGRYPCDHPQEIVDAAIAKVKGIQQ